MNATRNLAILLAAGFLLLSAACGGDDDGASPAGAPASSGGGDPAPSATAADSGGGPAAAGGGAASSSDASVGSITVGDETWMLVASVRCDFEPIPGSPLTVISIAGHAAGDESLEITIDFDPRDTGLVLIVKGAAGNPDWAADNESFVVRAGSASIGGDGMFSSPSNPGTTVGGTFDVRC